MNGGKKLLGVRRIKLSCGGDLRLQIHNRDRGRRAFGSPDSGEFSGFVSFLFLNMAALGGLVC